MHLFVLTLHILGALVSFYLVFSALFAVYKREENKFRSYFKFLALSALFEVVSGVILFLEQIGNSSLANFCAKITIYLVIIASTQILLYFKIRQREVVASSPL